MSDRITDKRIAAALAHYGDTLRHAGYVLPEGSRLAFGAPYGHVLYVYRVREGVHVPIHDVPGFMGSGGSGYVTKRAMYDAIMLASRTVSELSSAFGSGE